jgi:hypothetical protein
MLKLSELPVTRKIGHVYILCLVLALLLLLVTLFSIIYSDTIYGQNIDKPIIDTITLILILPLLLISMIATRKGHTLGMLSLSGIFYYISYNYFPYIFDVPFGIMFLPHILLVALSLAGLIVLWLSMDMKKIKVRFTTVPAKFAAGILIVLALFVLIFQVADIGRGLTGDIKVPGSSIALIVADLLLGVPIMLYGGISLWIKKGQGYAIGGSLLMGYMYLSLGLIPYFFLRAAKTETELDFGGLLAIAIMILLCAAPLYFFVHKSKKQKTENLN